MSCHKRKLEEEKEKSSPGKRSCFQNDSVISPCKMSPDPQPIRNIRLYKENEKKRILEILESEFDKELKAKEEEVIEIQERIHKTQRILQYLCYAVVADFYSREKTITSVASTRQRRIHPAVKRLLSGKGPPGAPEFPQNITIPADSSVSSSSKDTSGSSETTNADVLAPVDSPSSFDSRSSKEKKIPRYIPPKPKPKPNICNESEPVRGGQNKVKTILVVGNVSKWLPLDMRDDSASHKWMVYVRGPKGEPDISSFVSKVRFFLHPSYRPNDVVQVVCPPFHLSRRGWGEFPIRVQVHFSNSLNKPVDIIHNLKLDRTHCGLQTLGSETVAEVWIHREQPKTEVSSEEKSHDTQQTIKLEPDDFIENSMALSEETCTIPTSSSMELSNSSIKIEPTVSTLLESSQIAAEKTQPLYGEPNAPQPLVQTATTTSKAELICKTEEPPSNFSTPFKSTFTQVSSVKNDATSPKVTRTAADESSPHTFQSPANTVSSSGTISAIQTTQVPPTKPGTQLVKCIDSKGNVRLLQVRTDLLPKILKRGSTTIPATPPSSKEASLSNKTINPEKAVAPVTRAIQQTLPAKIVPPQGSTDTPPTVSQLPQSSQTTSAPVLPGTIKVTVTSPAIAQGIQTGVSPAVGVRPILQIVKPAGNLNVRPMLVVPNAASQQIIRLPASAASAGNRPLYVLKDGKLFMMKSALNAASKKIIPDAKTPSNILASREIAENLAIKTETAPAATTTILKTNLTKTANPSLTTKETPIVTSSMTNSHPQVTSNVTKIAIDNTSDTVKITPKSNVAMNAGLGLKVISPPGLSKLAPVGDTAISSVKKVHPTQQFTHPQSVSSPTVIPKATLKSGKSLLKPAVSLLKSNVGASTTGNNVNKPFPVSNNLQPFSKVSTSAQSPLPTAPVLDGFTATKRIVLGRTSGSSTITTYSQQALLYREILRSTIQACPKGPEEDVWRAVRWMIKNLPLINSEAKNLEFKILHPYCAPDEKTFCSWNIGKQRACEWQRAKTVRLLLKEAGWDQQNLWTTREIILWARFHGYTPGLPVLKSHQPRNIPCGRDDGCESPMAVMCNYGKIPDVEEWLEFPEKPSPLSNTNQQSEVVNLSDESEEEIDVTTTNSPSKVKVKQETDNVGTVDISEKMPLEPSLHTLSDMVTRSLNNIGLHLSSQELVSGVHYPAAQRVLIQAVQSLAEDLARRAYADAWGKDNITRQPGSIEISNVCSAICHRPEFDIFTCAGLGISSISDSQNSKK